MTDITCDVCMDLLPLVQDGIASEDSKRLVEEHIKNCSACAMLYDIKAVPAVNSENIFMKFKRKVQAFFAMLIMFGLFFGLGLTDGREMFYNSLIMPVIGVLGYVVFRWKSLYILPALMFVMHVMIFILNLIRRVQYWDFYSLVMWTVIYGIFVIVGIVIAGLLHFAFRKENGYEK
mgnify:CR=1 FL=1